MPKHKYQIPNPDLPSAIAWERTRANMLENWGYDVREIRALADNYVRRLMELDDGAETQQFADVPEAWSAESTNVQGEE